MHGTLSMKQAIDAAGADGSKVRDSLKGVPGATGSLEDAMIPVDVYVDADLRATDRPHRARRGRHHQRLRPEGPLLGRNWDRLVGSAGALLTQDMC
jgi:hypothetical protein